MYPFFTVFGFPDELYANTHVKAILASELFHFIDIILCFFKAYAKQDDYKKFETNFNRVWKNYFNTSFQVDLIVFLPFGILGQIHKDVYFLRYLWLIKL